MSNRGLTLLIPAKGNDAAIMPTTNLITNPSFETGTAGWAALGTGAIERSLAEAAVGDASLHFTGAAADDAAYFNAVALSGNLPFPFQARIKGSGTIRMGWSENGGDFYGDPIVLTDAFAPYSFTRTMSAAPGSGFPRVNQVGATPVDCYIDAVQVEQQDEPTKYVDGDQPDGEWTGTPHASTSTRGGG